MFPIEEVTYHILFATKHTMVMLSPALVEAIDPSAPSVVCVFPKNICCPTPCPTVQPTAIPTIEMIEPRAAVAGRMKAVVPPEFAP